MIGSLSGALVARAPDGCLLEVGGVGYELACSTHTVAALPGEGGSCRLWTHLHVREDSLALYGFSTRGERSMFEALIGVAGVGPKVALQVCSAFSPESFKKALATEDATALASVPGIGKKTAQRIVVDLKEKMQLPDLEVVGQRPDAYARARSALENLGYSPAEVRLALRDVEPDGDATVEELVKSALKALAG